MEGRLFCIKQRLMHKKVIAFSFSTRTRADQHKCLPHLPQYFTDFGQ